ncbi:hypothetical protein LRY65_02590 [Candidatus Woesebacteria bacterium]|nr:hypothetical protein [Candidatus Woesebacteria bacterium]MCD8507057.1 hypothetical protein [Candidatus Woesebacteria bacterium]MCD8527082.1 hypothetical protein [Candidatus Woesebacteria bacterium]MCD8546711.1 hypothetical protein [Candidatus Woesebacteria bacterium]
MTRQDSYLTAARAKRWAVLSCVLLLLGLGTPHLLKAQQTESMSSDSYIIQMGNFNTTSGEKSGGGYTVTDTVGQLAPGEYSSTGYKVFAGFQYIYAIPQFRFRITNLSMPLGELLYGSFAENSHQLIVTTRSGGYTILTQAQHELRRPGGPSASAIAHTNCDTSCSIANAGVWTSAENDGFGYSVLGTHAASDFVDGTYFRPFADVEDGQSAQTIASHNTVVRDDTVTVVYRAAVSGLQAAGDYSTTVDFIAVPTY